MNELDNALSQITYIRTQLAASTRFYGIAPELNVLISVLFFVAAVLQSLHPQLFMPTNMYFVVFWGTALFASVIIVSIEAAARTRRLHGRMAHSVLKLVLLKLLPFGVTGAAITAVIGLFTPETVWLLPGYWQTVIGLLGFAVLSSMPRKIVWVAGWYLVCGILVLWIAGSTKSLSPWMMGGPFTIGQLAVAVILRRDSNGDCSA